MALLRPAFGRYGRFTFNPEGHYTFQNIQVGNDVSIAGNADFVAAESRILIGNKVMFGPDVSVMAATTTLRNRPVHVRCRK